MRSAAVGLRLRPRRARLGGVALDVAHRRIQLGQRDRELCGTFGHGDNLLILIMSKSK